MYCAQHPHAGDDTSIGRGLGEAKYELPKSVDFISMTTSMKLSASNPLPEGGTLV